MAESYIASDSTSACFYPLHASWLVLPLIKLYFCFHLLIAIKCAPTIFVGYNNFSWKLFLINKIRQMFFEIFVANLEMSVCFVSFEATNLVFNDVDTRKFSFLILMILRGCWLFFIRHSSNTYWLVVIWWVFNEEKIYDVWFDYIFPKKEQACGSLVSARFPSGFCTFSVLFRSFLYSYSLGMEKRGFRTLVIRGTNKKLILCNIK